MSGSRSRNKGHNFEREIVNLIKDVFPEAKRNLEYQEGLGVDIANTDEFAIQCKVGRSFSIEHALAEAYTSEKFALAITKRDRQDIIVSMYFKDFKKLLYAYQQLKKDQ
jgi:hypothetical protein